METLAGPSVGSSPDIKITAIVNNNYYLLTVILVTKPRQIFEFGSFERFGCIRWHLTEKLVELSFCWHPPEVKNADIDLYKDAYGLVAIYTCRQGYAFTYGGTSRTSVCGGNQWTNKVPGCER